MKKKIMLINSVLLCISLIVCLVIIMYIFSYGGLALDESMNYLEYFTKVVELEWVILILFLVSIMSSFINVILIKKILSKDF